MSQSQAGGSRFATTRWSLVQAANRSSSLDARAALAVLCEAYWYPLYAFIRRGGQGPEDARDLTQAFFATLLEKRYLRAADRQRGRFRSFLLVACRRFVSKETERAHAAKRGGARPPLSLDFAAGESRYLHEPAHEMTAERLYERRWAMVLLDRVVAGLEEDHAQADKALLFQRLRNTLTGESADSAYSQIAADLGMTEGAVKTAAHRLRRQFRRLLREEIAQTVSTPEEIDDEIRLLFAAVAPDS